MKLHAIGHIRSTLGDAKSAPRQQVVVQTMLVVRDPQATVIAKLRDLVPAYPGSEAKVGSCEKAQ